MNTSDSASQALLDHLNILRDAGVRYITLDGETTQIETLYGQGEFDSTIAEPGPPVSATLTSATHSAIQRTSDKATPPVPRKDALPASALSLPDQEVKLPAKKNTVHKDTPPMPFDPEEKMTLEALSEAVAGCTRCQLGHSRTNLVFGVGNPNADLVFVGEAPGRDEDSQGIPFVGRAGQMLTRMIENVIEIPRSEVYICNVLKCRPPKNRNPEPSEIDCCEPYLHKQIEIINPRIIVALGKFAAQFLFATDTPIGKLRGKFGRYRGITTLATYHPAYLLRNSSQKRVVMDDLLKMKAVLDGAEPKIEILT